MWNFTAVSGALLYFGARRPWREMLAPLAALMAADYILTVYIYHFASAGRVTCLPGRGTERPWPWQILLKTRTSFVRWRRGLCWARPRFSCCQTMRLGGRRMYPRTAGRLMACYVAGVPFYRNDLLSTPWLPAGFGVRCWCGDERGADAAPCRQ